MNFINRSNFNLKFCAHPVKFSDVFLLKNRICSEYLNVDLLFAESPGNEAFRDTSVQRITPVADLEN